MIETDKVEAALKKHQMQVDAKEARLQRRKKEKTGQLEFKSDDEYGSQSEGENEAIEEPKESQYDPNQKVTVPPEDLEGSYDSELEADFFGAKDPEYNQKEDEKWERLR